MSELRITKKQLKTWLESKPKNKIVGQVKSGENCILANYLKENTKIGNDFALGFFGKDGKDGIVYKDYDNAIIMIYSCENKAFLKKELPMWCSKFCSEIIALNRKSTTAGKCLQILETI